VINKIIIRIPTSEIINKYSAITSNRFSLFISDDLIEIKEKIQDNVNINAITEVNSSII
jgi:hypothetical protein